MKMIPDSKWWIWEKLKVKQDSFFFFLLHGLHVFYAMYMPVKGASRFYDFSPGRGVDILLLKKAWSGKLWLLTSHNNLFMLAVALSWAWYIDVFLKDL